MMTEQREKYDLDEPIEIKGRPLGAKAVLKIHIHEPKLTHLLEALREWRRNWGYCLGVEDCGCEHCKLLRAYDDWAATQ